MCLAILLNGEFPPDDVLEAGAEQNPDGIGIAFPDGDKVQWFKGITLEQLKGFRNQATKGLIHFRLASVGPAIPQLCHPFPVSKTTSLKLEGRSDMALAHNGHWSTWRARLLDGTRHAVLPRGVFSDTRAMAFLAGIHGIRYLELLDEKVLVATPTCTWQFGTGWVRPKDVGYELSYDVSKKTYSYEWSNYGSPYKEYPKGHWMAGKWVPDKPEEAIGVTSMTYKEWKKAQKTRDQEERREKNLMLKALNKASGETSIKEITMAELDQVGDAVKEYLEETGQVEMQFSSEDEIALDYENSDICYAG